MKERHTGDGQERSVEQVSSRTERSATAANDAAAEQAGVGVGPRERNHGANALYLFLHNMIKQAVQEEIPRELAWLQGYDLVFSTLNNELDLPQKDLSALIRIIQSNQNTLSAKRRKQYAHLPDEVLDRVESVVRQAIETSKSTDDPSES